MMIRASSFTVVLETTYIRQYSSFPVRTFTRLKEFIMSSIRISWNKRDLEIRVDLSMRRRTTGAARKWSRLISQPPILSDVNACDWLLSKIDQFQLFIPIFRLRLLMPEVKRWLLMILVSSLTTKLLYCASLLFSTSRFDDSTFYGSIYVSLKGDGNSGLGEGFIASYVRYSSSIFGIFSLLFAATLFSFIPCLEGSSACFSARLSLVKMHPMINDDYIIIHNKKY